MPRVPRLPAAARASSSQLSAPETFLLSQVDGALDEDELALMTGVTPEQMRTTVDRLVGIGVLEAHEKVAPTSARPRPVDTVHRTSAAPGPPSARRGEEVIELDPGKRARIDELWGRLDDLTYYEILGLAHDADKKHVKSAYYALAPDFHPDKFFRKSLGPYKARIEAIFGRITLAHDILTVPERRAEYDAYLAQTQMNRSTAAVLEQAPEDVESILANIERAVAESASHPPKTPPPAPPSSPAARSSVPPATPSSPSSPARASMSPPSAPVSGRVQSPEEVLRQRREALARKLVGGRPAARPPARPMTEPPSSVERAARSAEAVRAHHQRAVMEAKAAQVKRSLDAGRAAIEAKEWATAANAFRVAASLDPGDSATQATCHEALQVVATALADGYWKQGLYEEAQGRWGDAALSYSKVCAGRPRDAMAHDRVALATIRSSTNFRRAVEFSRKAIEIDPKRPEFRITLALAYGAAGMEKSATSELERTLELGPKDSRIVTMVNNARASMVGLRATAEARLRAEEADGGADAAVGGAKTPTGKSGQFAVPPPPGSSPFGTGSPSGTMPAVSDILAGAAAGGSVSATVSASGAPSASPTASPPPSPPPALPRKPSGLHSLVNAVRSALAPKESK